MIYISGPISGVPNYLEKFAEAEYYLYRQYDDYVINPAKVLCNLPTHIIEYDDLMKLCLDLLSMCDAIYMLRGWEESNGALIEYKTAKYHNFKILYQK